MGRRLVVFAILLVACGDNLKPEPDEDTIVQVKLETHAPAQVAAGDPINVSCTLTENDIESMVTGEIAVTAETSVIRMGAEIIAKTAGSVDIACVLPGRGIVDTTPATVEIVAGAAANLVTTIVPDPVVAGNSITTTCVVYDAYGNVVTGTMPTLQLTPDDSANTITDLQALMTRAGHYTGRCYLPGTTSNNAAFDVVPNLPANLAISKFPDLPVYAVGQTVQVDAVVSDRYGNDIAPPPVTNTSAPVTGVGPTMIVNANTFRYNGEGLYRITVAVTPPTDNNVPLSATTDVVVNSRGPAVTCAGDATMVNLTPGSTMTVTGQANDVNGVSSISVNGNSVAVGANGAFSAPIVTRFGLNFVDVTALDAFGEPTTKLCTYLVSNTYGSPTNLINDEISLKLTQAAVDDGNRGGAINSLADVLYVVLNSSGLATTIDSSLKASNPLKPQSCDSQVCIPLIGCACLYSSRIDYQGLSLPGPQTVDLTLTTNGIIAHAHIPNIGVNLRVRGAVSGIGYDTSGWVTVSYIDVTLTLDLSISGGKPHISVRPGSVSSAVGSISTAFGGVDGWIINNIVVPLAQGSLRTTLTNLITNFVTNNFNAVLDGLVANLDISTLGTSFNVPRLDGSGNVPLSFGVGFSSLSTTTSRALFGISTKFTAPAANAYPSLGVPLPTGTILLDPTVSAPSNTGVGAHIGIIEHALHALWRANYLAATLTGAQLGAGLPAGTTISIVTRLPPVATILGNGTVQLQLGAIDLVIQHPFLPVNLAVRAGADAHASVTLVGNDLVFGNIVIDQTHVGTDDVNLDASEQQSLQTALNTLLQQLVNQSLNNALPAIPIPSFTIPASLGQYGLPVGGQLGIKSPSLSVAPQHFTLRGQFGVLP
ncbi:MAG TPA: hypothetical protein VFV99_03250 [Kofleriaceae bacterium]|nr:hypothetical protein [Kofleriaceae bacterium]